MDIFVLNKEDGLYLRCPAPARMTLWGRIPQNQTRSQIRLGRRGLELGGWQTFLKSIVSFVKTNNQPVDITSQILQTRFCGSRTRNYKKQISKNKGLTAVSETYCLPSLPLRTATWSRVHVGAHVCGHTWNATTLDRSTTKTQPFLTTITHQRPWKYLYTRHLTQRGRHTKPNSEHLARSRLTLL